MTGRTFPHPHESRDPLSIIVMGGSGDLAMKKIYPALFALFCQGFLPERLQVAAYARSPFNDLSFRAKVAERLTCRYTPGDSCTAYMERFLARCRYVQGQYDSREDFLKLYERIRGDEGSGRANRLFYMAIPPRLFMAVAEALGAAGLVSCDPAPGWSRAVIEKPFGRDRESSDALTASLRQVFRESQVFRIDHYLGKEVIQNLLVLRFANAIFEPLWSREHIAQVRLTWSEDFGVEGRTGYFDDYGIVRDVMQNHLLQMLALVAMEPPASLDAKAVRDAKRAVLEHVAPVALEDMVFGQYAGYQEEEGIAKGSRTPTYASAALYVENARWQGTPFLITAGKALDARMTEILIRFREAAWGLFGPGRESLPANELVLRVQPDEAIGFRIVNKQPGLGTTLVRSELNLRYGAAFDQPIPEAYESLLLDVLRGDKSLFIRADELAAAWDVFTPALHAYDTGDAKPERYPMGSGGPGSTTALAQRHGIVL
ncbi:MAG TPA: glucose-6-phosphate dehydrogenase [Candidatus Hydrogenedentes bacterium]|nr:glucose-6-phosphate dehydrogenase [Candidatus Hydrogenedentota bacterium]